MDTHISTVTERAASRARVATLCAAVLLLVLAIRVAATLEMPLLDDVPMVLFSFGIPLAGTTWALFNVGDYLRTYGLSEIPFEVVAALMVGVVAVAVLLLHRALEFSRRGST